MLKWLYIPAGIVLFILALLVYWFCSMHRNMPWQNCFAMLSNLRIKLSPSLFKYALSGERDYSTLPDPLVASDGTAIECTAAFEKRRTEILDSFKTEVYGTLPQSGFITYFETVEEGEALNGAALRKQIKISVKTDKGESEALMLMYIPKGCERAPVVFGLNFGGNHTALDDEAILPSLTIKLPEDKLKKQRGKAAQRWNIEENISRGYAVATVHSADFAPDSKADYASRVISLFDEPQFKAISAWAFGLMRMVDYFVQTSEIDSNRVAVVGHSRLGKAAVWAGANDQRIAIVISNDSGNTGASLSRGNHGETVYTINLAFPHWFCSEYAKYGKNENALPVDQNLLLACIAPRKLYVASAKGDLWADPQGAFNSIRFARAAFALYGLEVIPNGMESYPQNGEHYFCNSMAVHMRDGWHDINAQDWKHYLDYMDKYLTE